MNRFHARREDEDLEHREWQRGALEFLRIDLERDIGFGSAINIVLEVIGADRGLNQVDEGSQYPVLIEAGYGIEIMLYLVQ